MPSIVFSASIADAPQSSKDRYFAVLQEQPCADEWLHSARRFARMNVPTCGGSTNGFPIRALLARPSLTAKGPSIAGEGRASSCRPRCCSLPQRDHPAATVDDFLTGVLKRDLDIRCVRLQSLPRGNQQAMPLLRGTCTYLTCSDFLNQIWVQQSAAFMHLALMRGGPDRMTHAKLDMKCQLPVVGV